MTFPSSLRLKQKPIEKEPTSFQMPSSLKLKKKEIEETPDLETDENLERDIERNQAQFFSRMLERTIGLPGDIASLLPGSEDKRPPTSSELRGISEKLSLGYTTPKSEFEEKTGEFMGDVASFMTGGGIGKNALTTSVRAIGIPLAGQLAKEGFGGSDTARIGTMVMLDLLNARSGIGKGGAYRFGINSLEKAGDSIPIGSIADVSVFRNKLIKLKANLERGITGAHTNEGIRVIDQILGKITDNKMEASLFPRLRKDINTLIKEMKGFQIGGPSTTAKQATISQLNDVKGALIQAGNRWGRKNSPEFFKSWKEGNEALSAFYKSKQIGNILAKKLKVTNPFLKGLFGVGFYHNPVLATLGFATKKGLELGTKFPTEMAYRFFASKTLRNLYTQTLKEAAKGNGPAVAALSSKLEKQMKREKLE